jgi:predicted metal-dependent hydrolase
VTIPSRGTLVEARAFLQRNLEWLAKRVTDSQAKGKTTRVYAHGAPVWFRGQPVILEVDATNRTARLADYGFELRPYGLSLAVQVETAIWKLARRELPPLVLEAARLHGFNVKSVAVRSQRTRWGSCSARAVISLNWRLVQTPDFVRDYIILHELAHLRHLNHSQRYWAEVRRICPDYERAEAWLKEFGPKVI